MKKLEEIEEGNQVRRKRVGVCCGCGWEGAEGEKRFDWRGDLKDDVGMEQLFREKKKQGKKNKHFLLSKKQKMLVFYGGIALLQAFVFVSQLMDGKRGAGVVLCGSMFVLFVVTTGYLIVRKPGKEEEFEAWMEEPSRCGRCGYDISYGDVGNCPECGWKVPGGRYGLERERHWKDKRGDVWREVGFFRGDCFWRRRCILR